MESAKSFAHEMISDADSDTVKLSNVNPARRVTLSPVEPRTMTSQERRARDLLRSFLQERGFDMTDPGTDASIDETSSNIANGTMSVIYFRFVARAFGLGDRDPGPAAWDALYQQMRGNSGGDHDDNTVSTKESGQGVQNPPLFDLGPLSGGQVGIGAQGQGVVQGAVQDANRGDSDNRVPGNQQEPTHDGATVHTTPLDGEDIISSDSVNYDYSSTTRSGGGNPQ